MSALFYTYDTFIGRPWKTYSSHKQKQRYLHITPQFVWFESNQNICALFYSEKHITSWNQWKSRERLSLKERKERRMA